ncbi:MAG: Gfo/Idh/MocA family protein [Candidatus Spyradenecus sp.]
MAKQEAKLKVAMVGGGNESFMGHIHRAAIEASGCVELVGGAFGSTRQRSFETGKRLGVDPHRVYGVYRDMFRREAKVEGPDRLDFITVVAPNNMHYPVTMAAFDAGFPVFSEKPMSCNMDEAQNLKRRTLMSPEIYATAYVFPFYPALQELRACVAAGEIGNVRRVDTRFYHGWMGVRLETAGNRSALWRVDPRRCGAAGAIYDLAGSCALVAEWASGVELAALCAAGHPAVAGRLLDDDATVLLRFENGAMGMVAVSQIALGEANGLELAIFGDKGSVYWQQGSGNRWRFISAAGETIEHTVKGAPVPTQSPTRFGEPYGEDAAYIAALAAAYRDFAERIMAERAGKAPQSRCVDVDAALRVATFNDLAARSLTPLSDDAVVKWVPFRVPKVELLS